MGWRTQPAIDAVGKRSTQFRGVEGREKEDGDRREIEQTVQ